jgi:hypothetical protein
MHALLLFGLGVLIDWVWSLSVQAINEKRAYQAAAWQALFTAVAVGSTWFVIEARSVLGLVAYAAGGALGTFLAVRR